MGWYKSVNKVKVTLIVDSFYKLMPIAQQKSHYRWLSLQFIVIKIVSLFLGVEPSSNDGTG